MEAADIELLKMISSEIKRLVREEERYGFEEIYSEFQGFSADLVHVEKIENISLLYLVEALFSNITAKTREKEALIFLRLISDSIDVLVERNFALNS